MRNGAKGISLLIVMLLLSKLKSFLLECRHFGSHTTKRRTIPTAPPNQKAE